MNVYNYVRFHRRVRFAISMIFKKAIVKVVSWCFASDHCAAGSGGVSTANGGPDSLKASSQVAFEWDLGCLIKVANLYSDPAPGVVKHYLRVEPMDTSS